MACARCGDEGWIDEGAPGEGPEIPCPDCNAGDPPRKPKGWVSLVSVEPEPFYSPNKKPAAPRQPRAGEEVWRLRNADGREQWCELRDHARAGAGWDVTLLEGGEARRARRQSRRRDWSAPVLRLHRHSV
jgi:hypothetical protein